MTEETPDAAPNSCATCPSLLPANEMNEQIATYGVILNAPTCPRKGKLLGSPHKPGMNEQIQAAVGRSCGSHGAAMPPQKNRHGSLTIALGMPQIGGTGDTNPAARPRSCRSCQHFIPSKVMVKEIGVTSGMCARYGKIVADQNTTAEARTCPSAEGVKLNTSPEAHWDNLLADMIVNPELRIALVMGKIIGSNISEPVAPMEDPSTYTSDAPVTPEDEAKGIRAWRKLENETGTKHVFLPIFRPDFFPADEQELVPVTGDETNPELYVDHQHLSFKAAVIWKLNETPALHGVAGTGKTEFFRHMAWLMQCPFRRISITESTELDDIAGKVHYNPTRGTYFEEGRIPKGWHRPGVMVIDEPNVGKPAVWQFIRPMTDNAKQLVLDMDNGRRIDRHEFAFLGMAMNPAWDSRNVGTEVISDADGSRLMHIFVEFPDEKLEKQIIKERCKLDGYDIANDELNLIMRVAVNLRQMAKDDMLPITWGIRQQIKVARALAYFDPNDAYRLAAADYLEPEAQALILDAVNNETFGK